jgi:magnesium transporter
MRTLYMSKSGTQIIHPATDEIASLLTSPNGLLWVDFSNEDPPGISMILSRVFQFHPLAIDDALQQSHIPKIDDWVEYLYIVLHPIEYLPEQADPVQIHELDVFLGHNFLVTHHEDPIHLIDLAWEHCQRDERYVRGGVDYLFYKICDAIVASYLPIAEEIDDQIDAVEDQIFNGANQQILADIFRTKRSALKLRRVLAPQREVFNRMARDDYPVIDRSSRVYFRDIYDQLVLTHEIVENIRDLAGGTLDTYLSVVNNRMNEIMKTLTMITTIFMPASFLAGFFGMNFFATYYPMVEWTSPLSFLINLALMVSIPAGILLWIRRKGWV